MRAGYLYHGRESRRRETIDSGLLLSSDFHSSGLRKVERNTDRSPASTTHTVSSFANAIGTGKTKDTPMLTQ